MSETNDPGLPAGAEGAPAPEAEPAATPAPNDAPDTGTEATPQTETEAALDPVQARIDRLTREKWEARRQAETLQRQIRDLQQQQQQVDPNQQAETEIERRVAERVSVMRFNEACDRTFNKGIEEFPDFKEAVNAYAAVGGLHDKRAFLETINELPNGAAVFRHVSKDLEEAERILGMPPARQAVALAKISAEISAKASEKPSATKAPPPIKPLSSGKATNPDAEPDDMEAWVKWRDRQIAKKRSG